MSVAIVAPACAWFRRDALLDLLNDASECNNFRPYPQNYVQILICDFITPCVYHVHIL